MAAPKHLGMAIGVLLVAFAPAKRAWSQVDLVSRETFTGLLDLRLSATTGERSFVDGDFGKLRFDGGGSTVKIRPSLADAAIAWRPRLSWAWSATVHAEMQDGVKPDLIQAYFTYKPTPKSATRFQARMGLLYPEISLEHEGALWKTSYTITPSAINSWVGEEVKPLAVEATVRRPIGDHEFSATAAVFDYNDTSGTLLTFRGWALHDLKAPTRHEWALPPLDNFIKGPQSRESYPVRHIDDRIGYYGRLEWAPPIGATFNLFYYNNLGDKTSKDWDKQWSWATEFWNGGVNWALNDKVRILGQVMSGRTLMGFKGPKTIWIDMDFASAYVLATRKIGETDQLTGRLEFFRTRDNSPQSGGYAFANRIAADRKEDGWAMTAAYKRTLTPNAALFFEALHVSSERKARVLTLTPQGQAQTMFQTSLRLSF